jgi:hypothetical protein
MENKKEEKRKWNNKFRTKINKEKRVMNCIGKNISGGKERNGYKEKKVGGGY